MSATTVRAITDRMIGALRLEDTAYEEIEADTTATGQAAFIVVASSLFAAMGNALLRGGEVNAGFLVAIAQLVGWALNAWIAYLIGTKLIPGPKTRSNWGEIARTVDHVVIVSAGQVRFAGPLDEIGPTGTALESAFLTLTAAPG